MRIRNQGIVILDNQNRDRHSVACEMAGEVLRSYGKLRLQVSGWSMFPSVWPGDILIIHGKPTDVVEGDIILYERNSRLFAHRVIVKSGHDGISGVLTRGDAMPAPDPAVPETEVLGRISLIVRKHRQIEPRKFPPFLERVLAALFMHSEFAARVIVRIHGMRRPLPAPTI